MAVASMLQLDFTHMLPHPTSDNVQKSEGGVLKNTGWLFKPPVVFALPTHCTL
jgi:hypothetical protein